MSLKISAQDFELSETIEVDLRIECTSSKSSIDGYELYLILYNDKNDIEDIHLLIGRGNSSVLKVNVEWNENLPVDHDTIKRTKEMFNAALDDLILKSLYQKAHIIMMMCHDNPEKVSVTVVIEDKSYYARICLAELRELEKADFSFPKL